MSWLKNESDHVRMQADLKRSEVLNFRNTIINFRESCGKNLKQSPDLVAIQSLTMNHSQYAFAGHVEDPSLKWEYFRTTHSNFGVKDSELKNQIKNHELRCHIQIIGIS